VPIRPLGSAWNGPGALAAALLAVSVSVFLGRRPR
jgi:hypothetical protein